MSALAAGVTENTVAFDFAAPCRDAGAAESDQQREARWQADRERSWAAFMRNATVILRAPANHRDALLEAYHVQAASRYDERTALQMASSLRSWVVAQKVA